MGTFITTTDVNVRSQPGAASRSTRLARAPRETLVEGTGESQGGWRPVRLRLSGREVTGYMSESCLLALPLPAEFNAHVFAAPGRARLDADDDGLRACVLDEPGMPTRAGSGSVEMAASLGEIVTALAVAESARYRPGNGKTYCNIYAYDFCHLARGYLPHVWWDAEAWDQLLVGQRPAAKIGDTVTELSANQLYDWFESSALLFGWLRAFDLDEVQTAANAGKVCVASGRHETPGVSGHVSLIVPEIPGHEASSSSSHFNHRQEARTSRTA
jgi:hypothetical protein